MYINLIQKQIPLNKTKMFNLIIWGIVIKKHLEIFFSRVRLAKTQKFDNILYWERCRDTASSPSVWKAFWQKQNNNNKIKHTNIGTF